MFRSEEDYLKQIYELTIESDREQVKNVELAERLGHTDQSIIEKIKRLESKDYVKYEPYKGVSLTKKGTKEAIRLIRAHRLWEVFLFQDLEFSWSELHEDAEELEHASSEKVVERLYKYLKEPKYCYHGNPIPDLKGNLAPIAKRSLKEFDIGEKFQLKRVLDQKELLEFLDERKIKIGSEFLISEKNDFADMMEVNYNDEKILISNKIAEMIFSF